MDKLINIENKDGVLLVSSRKVAERFEKRHDHVLRDVEALLDQNPKLGADYFIESSYKAELHSLKRGAFLRSKLINIILNNLLTYLKRRAIIRP